jgi:peptide/nickel transport system substrate-binding protein
MSIADSMMKRRRLGVATLAAAALVSGCTAGSSAASGTKGGDTKNDTLLVNTSFVYSTLDPGRVYEQTGYMAVHSMYDALMTFDGADVSKPVPNLAKDVKVSDDKTTYTFTLRDDATFADGSPVTAQDVLFSLNRLENIKGSGAGFFKGITFAAPDDKTVVVTSPTPTGTIPTLMAMPAASVIEAATAQQNGATDAPGADTADTAKTFLDGKSIGSGPYVLERNDPGNEIDLVANDKYWGEKPKYERVVIRNTDVQNQKLSISRSGESEVAIDITGNLLDGLPKTLNVSQSKDTMYMLYLNTDPAVSPATSNPDWVAALRASIDYKGLAAMFGQGGGRIGGYVADAFPGGIPADQGPVQDLAKAKKLLAASGVGSDPVRFIYPAITYRGVDLGTIATKIEGDAAKAGIQLQLTPLALPAFLDEQRSGSAVIGFTPQALSYPLPESLVRQLSPGGTNGERVRWRTGDAATSVTAKANAVFAASSQDEVNKALVDWQKAMLDGSPFIALAQNSGTVVSTDRVAGADYTPAGWILDLARVSPA